MENKLLVKKSYNFAPLKAHMKLKPTLMAVGLLDNLLAIQYGPNTLESWALNPTTMAIEKGSVHQTLVLNEAIPATVKAPTPLQFSYSDEGHWLFAQQYDAGNWRTYMIETTVSSLNDPTLPSKNKLLDIIELSLPPRQFKRINFFKGNFLLVEEKSFMIASCEMVDVPCDVVFNYASSATAKFAGTVEMAMLADHVDVVYLTESLAGGEFFLNFVRIDQWDPTLILMHVENIPTKKVKRIEVIR